MYPNPKQVIRQAAEDHIRLLRSMISQDDNEVRRNYYKAQAEAIENALVATRLDEEIKY